jgi:hypothetical protein
LVTNGTVGLVRAGFEIVVFVETPFNTHATVVTVLKVLNATDAAKAAVLAVVGAFLVRHPEVANVAMVGAKRDSAVDALVAVVCDGKVKKKER